MLRTLTPMMIIGFIKFQQYSEWCDTRRHDTERNEFIFIFRFFCLFIYFFSIGNFCHWLTGESCSVDNDCDINDDENDEDDENDDQHSDGRIDFTSARSQFIVPASLQFLWHIIPLNRIGIFQQTIGPLICVFFQNRVIVCQEIYIAICYD